MWFWKKKSKSSKISLDLNTERKKTPSKQAWTDLRSLWWSLWELVLADAAQFPTKIKHKLTWKLLTEQTKHTKSPKTCYSRRTHCVWWRLWWRKAALGWKSERNTEIQRLFHWFNNSRPVFPAVFQWHDWKHVSQLHNTHHTQTPQTQTFIKHTHTMNKYMQRSQEICHYFTVTKQSHNVSCYSCLHAWVQFDVTSILGSVNCFSFCSNRYF